VVSLGDSIGFFAAALTGGFFFIKDLPFLVLAVLAEALDFDA
jgi:hypothetical protein